MRHELVTRRGMSGMMSRRYHAPVQVRAVRRLGALRRIPHAVTCPCACILSAAFCDQVRNMEAAKAFGWKTVLVGSTDRDTGLPLVCPEADWQIDSLHALPSVLPELFADPTV